LTILDPEHFLAQAERLIVPPVGRPRQVDLRRAISNAYYCVFHAILGASADHFVGRSKGSTPQYTLVYRSVDHGSLRSLCAELKNRRLTQKIASHAPESGFDPDIQALAKFVLELQEKRIAADYDPGIRVKALDARLAVEAARTALRHLDQAGVASREAFLSLLIFRPR
jgi:hypothetical protein